MFTKTFLASSLAALAAAAPTTRSNSVLQLVASHSGNIDVHLQNIHENGLRFWIGKDTATYCPSEVVTCPAGNQTAISIPSTSGVVGMNTEVPGGQLVYVTPSGEIGVTQAHSAAIPEGAVYAPFSYTAPVTAGSVGILTFNDSSFYACPNGVAGQYQIYAAGASEFVRTDCIGIGMTTAETQTEPVWQYI